MDRLTVQCINCGQSWKLANNYSLYEQQAVESCPCPRCGAYTLCCRPPHESRPAELASPVRGWRASPFLA